MSKVIGLLGLCVQISRFSESIVPKHIGTITKYLYVHILVQPEMKDIVLLS